MTKSIHVLLPQESTQCLNYQGILKQLGISFCCEISLQNIMVSDYDALLLPGGGDIDPHFYSNTNNGCHNIELSKDLNQFCLLDAFLREHKPVLGICKGMQLIQVYFGGSLIQELPSVKLHYHPDKDIFHSTLTRPDSILDHLYGRTPIVNSSHHQGILHPAPKLQCIQKSGDGITEAFVHESLPVLGLQWHPERLCPSKNNSRAVDGTLIYQYFFEHFL